MMASGFSWRQIPMAVVALALAYAAFSNAMGNVVIRSHPALAARQLGANPSSDLATIDLGKLAQSKAPELDAAAAKARDVVRRQAVSPMALAILGVVGEARHQPAEALKMFTAVDRLSRRHLISETWLLEHYVAGNDIPRVLKQYDILLRQVPEMQAVAFPILDSALADPVIQDAFRPYLNADTPWMREFLGFTAVKSEHPDILTNMLLRTGKVPTALKMDLPIATMFSRLTQMGHVALVRPLYLASRLGPPNLLSTLSLNEVATSPTIVPVAWTLAMENGVSAQVLAGADGGAMINVAASNSRAQQAVQKLLFLNPGRYRLSFAVEMVRQAEGASAAWHAICLSAKPAVALGKTGNVLAQGAEHKLDFNVAPGCDAVQLVLEVSGDVDEQGFEANFSKLRLEPIVSRSAQ